MKMLRRLLVVLLLLAVVVGVAVWVVSLPPEQTSRATATVTRNGVPQADVSVLCLPLNEQGGIRNNFKKVFGATNKEGRCELRCFRKAYDPLPACRGILGSPLSSAQWSRLFIKTAWKETINVPIGNYKAVVGPGSANVVVYPTLVVGSATSFREFTIEISPDPSKNHFVFDLSDDTQP